MESYPTLSEALNGLKSKGYTYDFNLATENLECKELNLRLHPEDFVIDEVYRFEGASNPDDNSIVYAISSKDGLKGTLVNAYGVYADSMTDDMIAKLRITGRQQG
jgi:hypothetical protein